MTSCKNRISFNCQVTIKSPNRSATAGDDNQIDYSNSANWSTYAIRRAKVRQVSGREYFTEQQPGANRSHVVTMFADSKTRQMRADYRIEYTDRDSVAHVLYVVASTITDDGRYVQASCMEDVD